VNAEAPRPTAAASQARSGERGWLIAGSRSGTRDTGDGGSLEQEAVTVTQRLVATLGGLLERAEPSDLRPGPLSLWCRCHGYPLLGVGFDRSPCGRDT
jgi:hypothetical protein